MSMPPKTLAALLKEDAHWKRLASGKRRLGESIYGKHCALCKLFAIKEGWCLNCPVAERTKLEYCRGTPLEDVYVALKDHGYDSPQFLAAAKKQSDFIHSLIPKAE